MSAAFTRTSIAPSWSPGHRVQLNGLVGATVLPVHPNRGAAEDNDGDGESCSDLPDAGQAFVRWRPVLPGQVRLGKAGSVRGKRRPAGKMKTGATDALDATSMLQVGLTISLTAQGDDGSPGALRSYATTSSLRANRTGRGRRPLLIVTLPGRVPMPPMLACPFPWVLGRVVDCGARPEAEGLRPVGFVGEANASR